MNETASPAPALNGALALPDWGVIRASGEDARSFLHGQLTQDIKGLKPGVARPAGYCSAKGRLLASFIVWADEAGDILLACSADVLPATLKRLSMFVMRAKCKLSDASAALPLYGLAGGAVRPSEPWAAQAVGSTWVIRLPDGAGVARALCVGAPDANAAELSADDWRWLEVQGAQPRIVAATQERFVPQMVNLEVVGGVDFGKGCYPGQEVVARSQYRGSLKRRSYVMDADASLQPGQEVFDASAADQPAGMVVLAGSRGGAHHAALVELKIAALDADLRAGSASGPRLKPAAQPYALPQAAE